MEIRTPLNLDEWGQYYDLRYRLLREPWEEPRGSERNDADAFSIHLACFEQDKILGVVRLDTHESDEIAQVRFMAVDFGAQGKGIGRMLMSAAELHAKRLGYKKVMLQARENALPFYTCMGYQLIEKSHLLFGVIQHYKMAKLLD